MAARKDSRRGSTATRDRPVSHNWGNTHVAAARRVVASADEGLGTLFCSEIGRGTCRYRYRTYRLGERGRSDAVRWRGASVLIDVLPVDFLCWPAGGACFDWSARGSCFETTEDTIPDSGTKKPPVWITFFHANYNEMKGGGLLSCPRLSTLSCLEIMFSVRPLLPVSCRSFLV